MTDQDTAATVLNLKACSPGYIGYVPEFLHEATIEFI